jgi:hypothetical protein
MKSENKYYHLFLDDDRNPKDVTWIDLPLVEWIVVRNYEEFVKTINLNGVPSTISFDHDIVEEHYQEYSRIREAHFKIPLDYSRFTEKTGMDCARWLANYCIDRGLPIPIYYVHTLNGPAAANIFSVLESARQAMA